MVGLLPVDGLGCIIRRGYDQRGAEWSRHGGCVFHCYSWRVAAAGWQSRDAFFFGTPSPEGGELGGIMERLARQPKVGDMNDVLKTMNSFQCDASWGRVFQNMAMTNSLGLGVGGFKIFDARKAAVVLANHITGVSVAGEFGLPTTGQFLFGGFRGMTLGGVTFTGGETGVLTAAGAGAGYLFTSVAWQVGVLAGSVLNVATTAPCRYTN